MTTVAGIDGIPTQKVNFGAGGRGRRPSNVDTTLPHVGEEELVSSSASNAIASQEQLRIMNDADARLISKEKAQPRLKRALKNIDALSNEEMQAYKPCFIAYGTPEQKDVFFSEYRRRFPKQTVAEAATAVANSPIDPVAEYENAYRNMSKKTKALIKKLQKENPNVDNDEFKRIVNEALNKVDSNGKPLFSVDDVHAANSYIDKFRPDVVQTFEQKVAACKTPHDIKKLYAEMENMTGIESTKKEQYKELLQAKTKELADAKLGKNVANAADTVTDTAKKGAEVAQNATEKAGEVVKDVAEKGKEAAKKMPTWGWVAIGAGALIALLAGVSAHNKNKQQQQLNAVA